jgi:hypothetical protein
MDRKDLKTTLLWLWVVGVMVAYTYQFRDFVEPFLDLLGLA